MEKISFGLFRIQRRNDLFDCHVADVYANVARVVAMAYTIIFNLFQWLLSISSIV